MLYKNRENQRLFLALAMFTLAVLIFGMIIVNRSIQVPISLLLQYIKEIADGNFKENKASVCLNEFQKLFSAFGEMAQKLQKKDMQLHNSLRKLHAASRATRYANEELEERVLERTGELENAMDKAEAANRAKSDFLATMSHEIRTPMNGVLGMLHLLNKSELNNSQRRYIKTATSSSELLLTVINDILDFSKLEAEKVVLESVPFNPTLLVEETASTLAIAAREKNLELVSSIAPAAPCSIMGDPTRLRQVLINLASNAIKFTQSGHVTLYAVYTASTRMIHYGVSDTGIGLTQEQQKNIFKAFTQADNTHTRKYGGTGLGLAICNGLVKAMGSSLKVSSEPGIGSDFYFDLPAEESEKVESTPAPPKFICHKHFLVVDDQIETWNAIEHMLNSWEMYNIDQVDSWQDVLPRIQGAAAAGQPYDILLLNSTISSLPGTEMVQAIRSEERSIALHIMELLSLNQDEPTPGVDAWINKPICQSELLSTLLDLYEKPETTPTTSTVEEPRDWWFDGRKLLLAEDNSVNQEVATEILIDVGFSLDIRENGEEAVAAVQETKYDAVLMDIQMPIMDGLTASREIRALGGDYANLPIIAMTAHVLIGDREKSLKAGMNGHIAKPFKPEELFSELALWIPKTKPPQEEIARKDSEEEVAIPDLPGIDTTEALKRLNGKKRSYLRIVWNYRNKNLDTVDRIEREIRSEQLSEAAHLAHSLKGSSGNIGAMQVYEDAAMVEQLCRNQQSTPALEALKNLNISLKQVIDGLAQVDKPGNKPPHTQADASVDLNSFKKTLKQLHECLDMDLRQAGNLLKECQKKVDGSEYSQALEELEEALNNFDIDPAKMMIERILQ